MNAKPGSLVKYREREWVVMPSEDQQIVLLRPIGGSARETCGVLKPLSNTMGYSLPFERISETQFPLPDSSAIRDLASVKLTIESARLLLREGAAPFRSPGHLSIRPRPYQFVPLIMALRLDTVRLLIADDVGIGKTIEAGLIARELLDRGDIKRIAVLCPPYLCDQWQRELSEKFHIDAVVIRSGTVSRLERLAPQDVSIFKHNRHFIASIDTVKGEGYRNGFLTHCPELVIVDEAHGSAQPPSGRQSYAQQQRHELLRDLAKDANRNIMLLTATPHSGIEESFKSILGLLKPEFRNYNLSVEKDRIELAKYFVQRRRADIKRWLGEDTPFPERDEANLEQPYKFSDEYKRFYDRIYGFAHDIISSAEALTGWRKRMRFWSALALLRCVTSSPASAKATLLKRLTRDDEQTSDTIETLTDEELDASFRPIVSDPMEAEAVIDVQPSSIFDAQEQDSSWKESDRRRLREFANEADKLYGNADNKLLKLISILTDMLKNGYNPIVWCRYIATADYVADELRNRLSGRFSNLKVASITGTLSEDDRKLKMDELTKTLTDPRILVATDCLSEGVNLQEHFNAVIHYDLPWNPNRLEQREGRVDRFGQTSPKVRVALIFGTDNPVDGAVLDVILRKARDIRRDLGIHVPVPEGSQNVMETIINSILARSRQPEQLTLDFFGLGQVHEAWSKNANDEKESRSRFAQHTIKPEEIEREIKETDAVLGDPKAIIQFMQEASQRLEFEFRQAKDKVWEINVSKLPDSVRLMLGSVSGFWRITFDSPSPEGIAYIGRNHPLIESLAEHLMDIAFHPTSDEIPATRCGVIRTSNVSRRTTLLLLRLRYLIYERGDDTPSLAEETLTWGFRGFPLNIDPISFDDANRLLDDAKVAGNVSPKERQELIDESLSWWKDLQPKLQETILDRAVNLEESYKRVRTLIKSAKVRIEPQDNPDLMGIIVLLPRVEVR